ncbi:hypothetical protein CFP59_08697 [Streptomyces malaysiensis subsp. malaysiensis]|nr:hypothetical protein CFP59_08697 [Streptomyces sp. M56]
MNPPGCTPRSDPRARGDSPSRTSPSRSSVVCSLHPGGWSRCWTASRRNIQMLSAPVVITGACRDGRGRAAAVQVRVEDARGPAVRRGLRALRSGVGSGAGRVETRLSVVYAASSGLGGAEAVDHVVMHALDARRAWLRTDALVLGEGLLVASGGHVSVEGRSQAAFRVRQFVDRGWGAGGYGPQCVGGGECSAGSIVAGWSQAKERDGLVRRDAQTSERLTGARWRSAGLDVADDCGQAYDSAGSVHHICSGLVLAGLFLNVCGISEVVGSLGIELGLLAEGGVAVGVLDRAVGKPEPCARGISQHDDPPIGHKQPRFCQCDRKSLGDLLAGVPSWPGTLKAGRRGERAGRRHE